MGEIKEVIASIYINYLFMELTISQEYVRVESLVDAFTVWNVRVGPGATVADVCENLGKKIDAKYHHIFIYFIFMYILCLLDIHL
jgi:hypothetical protein